MATKFTATWRIHDLVPTERLFKAIDELEHLRSTSGKVEFSEPGLRVRTDSISEALEAATNIEHVAYLTFSHDGEFVHTHVEVEVGYSDEPWIWNLSVEGDSRVAVLGAMEAVKGVLLRAKERQEAERQHQEAESTAAARDVVHLDRDDARAEREVREATWGHRVKVLGREFTVEVAAGFVFLGIVALVGWLN